MVAFSALSSRNGKACFTRSCHGSNQSYLVQLYQPTACLTILSLVGNLDYLDVNPADPFAKYAPPSGRLSTVNSGAIYNLAYKNRCKKPDDFLVGIIFACDENKLQKGSKAGSWLLMFTVFIINQKMRNLPIAWKSLGHIFDLSMI